MASKKNPQQLKHVLLHSHGRASCTQGQGSYTGVVNIQTVRFGIEIA